MDQFLKKKKQNEIRNLDAKSLKTVNYFLET